MKLRKIKSKKAEGVFGMSFSMIFSIILIVFFIIVAFIAIKFFLGNQKDIQVGMFLRDFEDKVKLVFNAEGAVDFFNSSLPTGIEQVCIINLSKPALNTTSVEQEVYDYITREETYDFKNNVYLYSPTKLYSMRWSYIAHINVGEKNPKCYRVKNGVVSIKLERNYENPFVMLK